MEDNSNFHVFSHRFHSNILISLKPSFQHQFLKVAYTQNTKKKREEKLFPFLGVNILYFTKVSAILEAMITAFSKADVLTIPFPAISNAVPWAQVTIGAGNPPAMVIP